MESAVGTNIDDPFFLSCPYPVCFRVISLIPVLKEKKKKRHVGFLESTCCRLHTCVGLLAEIQIF